MRRTPNRTRVIGALAYASNVTPRMDADLENGSRTVEAMFLRIVRECGTWIPRGADEWERCKRLSARLIGKPHERYLCGHEV